MTNPKFSVIIPIFNSEQTIVATIDSVLKQTEKNLELIIVDDGSTDNSLTLALDIAQTDKRIKVKSQPNGGAAAARNFGLTCARGDLIAFLDADDSWLSAKLNEHRQFHERFPEVAISFAKVQFVSDGRGSNPSQSNVKAGEFSVEQLIAANPTCTSSNIVVRKDCLDTVGEFREDMLYAEDQEWLVRARSNGLSIHGIDRHLVDYRTSEDGLSADLDKMYAGWRLLAITYGDPLNRSNAEAQYCRYLARRALRTGARATVVLKFAARGLRLNAAGFFSDKLRGSQTLFGALVAPILPRKARMRLFA